MAKTRRKALIALAATLTLSTAIAGTVTLFSSNVDAFAEGTVAEYNDTKYSSIKDALEAIEGLKNKTGTVKLLQDVNENVTIVSKSTVTLDLNGYTLTNDPDSGKTHTITNNGTLTVVDSSEEKKGTVDNVTHGKAAVWNDVGATATLDGGTYIRSKENGQSLENSGGNSYYVLVNHGSQMTINAGVTVKQDGHFSSMVENGWYNGKENTKKAESVLTINDGYFSGGANTIKNDDYGVIHILGGTFENMTQAVFLNWNVATVSGGTFNAEQAAQVILNGGGNPTMNKGELSVTGGNFIAAEGKKVLAPMNGVTSYLNAVEITAGSFSETESIQSHLAEGVEFATVTDEEGNVSYVNYAAYVDKTGYASLPEALAAAEENATVKLNSNVSIYAWDVAKSVTLDLNGKTLTALCAEEHAGIYVEGDKTLTITDSAQDGKIYAPNGYGIMALQGGSVTVGNGTIESLYAPISSNNTTGVGDFTVKGGKLIAKRGPAIYMPAQQYLTISGGELVGGVIARMGEIKITGGTLYAPTENLDKIEEYYKYSGNAWLGGALTLLPGTYGFDGEEGNGFEVDITGGKFVNECGTDVDAQFRNAITVYMQNHKAQAVDIKVAENVEFEVAEGAKKVVFTDVATVVGDKYNYATADVNNTPKYNGEELTLLYGSSVVSEKIAAEQGGVAVLDGKVYESVSAALAAATENATIKLLGNVKEDIVVSADAKVTLDLNGYTLTNEKDHTITNKGTLTIIDSSEDKAGVVDNITQNKAAVFNELGATLTIKAGKYTKTENDYYVIVNQGTATIDGKDGKVVNAIEVSAENIGSSLIISGWATVKDVPDNVAASLTINNGTFTGGLNNVKNESYSALTIANGTFTVSGSDGEYVNVMNYGSAEISEGTFINNSTAAKGTRANISNLYNGDLSQSSEMTISGGTFVANTNNVYNVYNKRSTLAIKGGEFKSAFHAVYSQTSESTVTIENATITGANSGVNVSGTKLTIKDTEIKATNESNGIAIYVQGGSKATLTNVTATGTTAIRLESGNGTSATIESGNYDGALLLKPNSANNIQYTLNGGTFTELPKHATTKEDLPQEDYIGAGFATTKVGDVYTVVVDEISAAVNDAIDYIKLYALAANVDLAEVEEKASADGLADFSIFVGVGSATEVRTLRDSAVAAIDAYIAQFDSYKTGKVEAIQQVATEYDIAVSTATVFAIQNAHSFAQADEYVAVAEAEIKDIAAYRYDTVKKDLDALIKAVNAIKTSVGDDLSGDLANVTDTIDGIVESVDALETLIKADDKSIMDLITTNDKNILAELASTQDKLATTANNLFDRIVTDNLNPMKVALQNQIAALEESEDEEFAKLAAQLTAIQATLNEKTANKDDIASVVEAVATAKTDLTAAIEAAKGELATKLTALDGKLDGISKDIATLSGAVAKNNTDLLAKIAELKADVAAVGGQVSEFDAKTIAAIADLQNAINNIGAQVGVATSVQNAKDQAVESLAAYADNAALVKTYGEDGAKLIKKYYVEAMKAIDESETKSDVSSAVSTFKAQAAVVEAVNSVPAGLKDGDIHFTEVYALIGIVAALVVGVFIGLIFYRKKK